MRGKFRAESRTPSNMFSDQDNVNKRRGIMDDQF